MSENETVCPVCLADNQCMAHSKTPCWCNNVKIPQELLDLVPQEQRGKSCICLSCINAFNDNPIEFTKTWRNKG